MPARRIESIRIPPAESLAGSPFCYRYSLEHTAGSGDPPGPLADSIARLGIIEPPLAAAQGPAGGPPYLIITGHRRLAAAISVGLETAEILVIGEAGSIPYASGPPPGTAGGALKGACAHAVTGMPDGIISIWLEDAAGSSLSDMEKLLLVRRTVDLSGERLPGFLPSLSAAFGRAINISFIPQLMDLLGLPPDIHDALHSGRISTGDLLALSSHPRLDTARAARVLASQRMTAGQRREAVRLMLYLADQGKGPGGKDLISSFLSGRRGGGDALEYLRRLCHPRMSDDAAEAERLISGIGLPPGASMRPPENMEGGSYTMEIKIRSEDGLRAAAEKIGKALEEGTIRRLLEILRGEGGPKK